MTYKRLLKNHSILVTSYSLQIVLTAIKYHMLTTVRRSRLVESRQTTRIDLIFICDHEHCSLLILPYIIVVIITAHSAVAGRFVRLFVYICRWP